MNLGAVGSKLLAKSEEIKSGKTPPSRCFVGFDGFTDTILSAVESRINADSLTLYENIAAFGQKILDSSGKSCNIELIEKQVKIGGNAPIFCNAILEGGHRVSLIGALGAQNSIEPIFKPLTSRCEHVFSLCSSGRSDAIEFEDGKIILGKLQSLNHVTFETILQYASKELLVKLLDSCDLFMSANWTMLPHMTDIWENLANSILPRLSSHTPPRWMFLDLADPAKRTDSDIRLALKTLSKFHHHFRIVLGLNIAEAARIAKILNLNFSHNSPEELMKAAKEIRQVTGFYTILIHSPKLAVAANPEQEAKLETFFCQRPILTTGAGDNFNAGYCNALLYGLNLEESLASAVATAGFYVRFGHSPSMEELAHFLKTASVA